MGYLDKLMNGTIYSVEVIVKILMVECAFESSPLTDLHALSNNTSDNPEGSIPNTDETPC